MAPPLTVFYVTHPQVAVDPSIPVTAWGLDDRGRERARAMLGQPWISGMTAMDTCLSETIAGDVMIVGHGGVGTLWSCHLADVAIDRRHDQPGQGHYFAVDPTSGRPRHGWRPIDDLTPE